MNCVACKTRIKSPLLVGGMEVNLCERCQPRPNVTKAKEGAYDDYDREDA